MKQTALTLIALLAPLPAAAAFDNLDCQSESLCRTNGCVANDTSFSIDFDWISNTATVHKPEEQFTLTALEINTLNGLTSIFAQDFTSATDTLITVLSNNEAISAFWTEPAASGSDTQMYAATCTKRSSV